MKKYKKCQCSKSSATTHKRKHNKRKRDYRKEYLEFGGKKKQIRLRSLRNQARRKLGLKVGDSREVDHIRPLSKNGTNSLDNLRVMSRAKNRRKGSKMK
jgi:5-methylcytosine-specific restriction endonuclease McrA